MPIVIPLLIYKTFYNCYRRWNYNGSRISVCPIIRYPNTILFFKTVVVDAINNKTIVCPSKCRCSDNNNESNNPFHYFNIFCGKLAPNAPLEY